jgi:hypothetical protein
MKLKITYQQDPKPPCIAMLSSNKVKGVKILNKDFQPIRLNMKYNGPFSKEWKNNIYYYNKYIMKGQNIVNNQNIDKIIKSYFHLSFKAVKLL